MSKIAAGVVTFFIVCLIALFYFTNAKKKDEKKEPKQLEEELRDMKSRISAAEGYKMYEGYESPGNPGLTVAGTILECMLDVAVAILAQDNSRKIAQEFIQNENDAAIFAKGIRGFTDDAITLIESTNFIKCIGEGDDPCLKVRAHHENIENVFDALMNESVEKHLMTDDMKDSTANIVVAQFRRAGEEGISKEYVVDRLDNEWTRVSNSTDEKGVAIDEEIETALEEAEDGAETNQGVANVLSED